MEHKRVLSRAAEEYCEREYFEASCSSASEGDPLRGPVGEVILMRTALYGRMKVGRCVKSKEYGSIGCHANVIDLVDTRWVWVVSMDGKCGWWAWVVSMGGEYGWWVWVVSVGGECGWWVWVVSMGGEYGWWVWVVSVRGEYGWWVCGWLGDADDTDEDEDGIHDGSDGDDDDDDDDDNDDDDGCL